MTRLALIGNGTWGKNYLSEVKKLKDVEISVVKTHDWKDLIGNKDIDGIIIATPDRTHSEIIEAFPDTYLLVEKPFVTDIHDAVKFKDNKKIMIGYIYLYNLTLQEKMKDIGQIRKIIFSIHSDREPKDTNIFWYLLTHPLAFCILHLGRAKKLYIEDHNESFKRVILEYPFTRCELEVKWNTTKSKYIEVQGDKTIKYDGTEEHPITPLENQLQSFVNFIHGTAIPTNTRLGLEVTNAIYQLEQMYK